MLNLKSFPSGTGEARKPKKPCPSSLRPHTSPATNPFIRPEHRVGNIPIKPNSKTAEQQNSREELAYLLKLSGWPCGPLRTVMPEVPVEPALLGAGLV